MRMYRAGWMVLVELTAGISFVLACLSESPWLLLTQVMAVGAIGMAFGAVWEEEPAHKWRVGRAWALRGLVTAVVLVGLPHLIGAWSLIVLMALGLLSPSLVLAVARHGRGRPDPAAKGALGALSDDELARRWRYSSIAVRSSWRSPAEVLGIVGEREGLLDEIEDRDPEGFSQWLVAAGWRESPRR